MGKKVELHRELGVYQLVFETAETQTWLEFAVKCTYLDAEVARSLYKVTLSH
jgi:hypothetical protein